MRYDIIGDVHGHADALECLLKKLGYAERMGTWRHPDRIALFVGDFIDRGPKQVESVTLARRMVDAGSALAVMGNHEFNAIAWFLPDPGKNGEFLRPHFSEKYGASNRRQHEAFLAAVEGRPAHTEIIDWFLTLPLWLDLPELRVVHACWYPRFMEYLGPQLLSGNRLTADLMIPASLEPADEREKDTPVPTVFKAVEVLMKGIEIPLPAGFGFADKDDIRRRRVRIRWWDAQAVTFRSAAMPGKGLTSAELPDELIPEHTRIGYSGPKPVFVGHYWLKGEQAPFAPNVACVDYSIAQEGRLAAYRFDGEPELDARRFISVGQGEP